MCEVLERFLFLSDGLRPGYRSTLEYGSSEERRAAIEELRRGAPDPVVEIYSCVAGTPRSTEEQLLVDFIPGYRLIYYRELQEHISRVRIGWPHAPAMFPFLADYSGAYCCFERGLVVSATPDDYAVVPMHESWDKFLATVCSIYEEGGYFLDRGLLESVDEIEDRVGRRINPTMPYWFD